MSVREHKQQPLRVLDVFALHDAARIAVDPLRHVGVIPAFVKVLLAFLLRFLALVVLFVRRTALW